MSYTVIGRINETDVLMRNDFINFCDVPKSKIVKEIEESIAYKHVKTGLVENAIFSIETYTQERKYKGIEYVYRIDRTFNIQMRTINTMTEMMIYECNPQYKITFDSKLNDIIYHHMGNFQFISISPTIEERFQNTIDEFFTKVIPKEIKKHEQVIAVEQESINKFNELSKIYEGVLNG